MSDPTIEAIGLTKTFGSTRALDGFDLRVEPGQVAGFLGPNGAGKSTAIRVLLGLLRADGGSARVLGLDPWADAVELHPRISYLPGDVNLWPNFSGGETIDLLLRMHGRPDDARRAELIERFDLDPSKKVRAYSKGNRQKVALVAALAVEAELYLLDEPTSGLDPLMEEIFTDEVRRIRDRGRSVLLSSHILAEVEKVCDTVTIIRNGRAVESGTLSNLRHLTRSTVTVVPSGDASGLGEVAGVHDLVTEDGQVRFDVDGAAAQQVLGALADLGVERITWTPPSLEDLFLRHYGDHIEEAVDGAGSVPS